jgi:hypothetical protein
MPFTPSAITWGKCEGRPRLDALGAQCGYLTVPLDYAKPAGTKIKLAVSRIKHTVTADKFQGVMLTNPGGPGGSGLSGKRCNEVRPDTPSVSVWRDGAGHVRHHRTRDGGLDYARSGR